MPEYLTSDEVTALHDDQIATFGGQPGIRDQSLLESAVAQPGLEVFGRAVHAGLPEQAAAYLYHLPRNHPFFDANKRTAVSSILVFLHLNGARCQLSNDELFELVLNGA